MRRECLGRGRWSGRVARTPMVGLGMVIKMEFLTFHGKLCQCNGCLLSGCHSSFTVDWLKFGSHHGMTHTTVTSWWCVMTRFPEVGPAYAWQLSRIPRISSQTNTCFFYALCSHSCTPEKDFLVDHPVLQAKHTYALFSHTCAPGKDFPVGHPSLQAQHT
jgi:hypothetical protein